MDKFKKFSWKPFTVEKMRHLLCAVYWYLTASIPHHYVEMSSQDKPSITPFLKHLINCRYDAYWNDQFSKYNHLKLNVKLAIGKAKPEDKMFWEFTIGNLGIVYSPISVEESKQERWFKSESNLAYLIHITSISIQFTAICKKK